MSSDSDTRRDSRRVTAADGTRERAPAQLDASPVLDGLARRLLDAGRRNFVRYGYQKASVAEIAREAGTSVGLLYYHFVSKQGLYRAIWADYQQHQWQQTREAIALVRGAGVQDSRLLFLVGTRAYMAHCWDNRDIVTLVHNHDAPPGFTEDRRAMVREWAAMNRKLLKLQDDLFAQVLSEMAVGALSEAAGSIAKCETREEADEVADIAIQIFGHMLEYSTDLDKTGQLKDYREVPQG